MGHTFVSRGDIGFWMHDSILELWLRLLALHIPEPTDADTPARHNVTKQIRDQWLLASKGFFLGCVPVALEDATATDEGKAIVRLAIESLRKALSTGPKIITRDAMSLLGFEDVSHRYDLEAARLMEVGNAFLDLMDGKITTTAKDGPYIPRF